MCDSPLSRKILLGTDTLIPWENFSQPLTQITLHDWNAPLLPPLDPKLSQKGSLRVSLAFCLLAGYRVRQLGLFVLFLRDSLKEIHLPLPQKSRHHHTPPVLIVNLTLPKITWEESQRDI